jgi:branched-chain amino acid aminotransferase
MSHSAECVSIPPIPEDHFVRCVELAVTANSAYVPPHTSQALLYIRPVAFGSGEMIGLAPPSEFTFCVFVKPANAYHGTKPIDALVLEDFDRAAPRGTGNAKVGGNYAPVMRWSGAAMKEGYGITLHLDSATRSEIDEFSSAGFMGIKTTEEGKITVVIPDSAAVIDSVTSDSCVTLAKEQGWTVEKRPVSGASRERRPGGRKPIECGLLKPMSRSNMKSSQRSPRCLLLARPLQLCR